LRHGKEKAEEPLSATTNTSTTESRNNTDEKRKETFSEEATLELIPARRKFELSNESTIQI
jgi:hypothetical protein